MWNDWLSCTAANTTVFTYYFDQMFANAIVPSVSTFYPQLQKTDKQTKCRWIEQTDRFWSQIETLSEHQNAESVLLTSTFIIKTFSEHPKQSLCFSHPLSPASSQPRQTAFHMKGAHWNALYTDWYLHSCLCPISTICPSCHDSHWGQLLSLHQANAPSSSLRSACTAPLAWNGWHFLVRGTVGSTDHCRQTNRSLVIAFASADPVPFDRNTNSVDLKKADAK